MKITYLTSTVSRNAGGLYTSVRRLSQSVTAAGERVEVLGYLDEFTSQDIDAWKPIYPRTIDAKRIGGVHFGGHTKFLLENIGPDITHVHGLWLRISAQNLAWHKKKRRPYLISPRGMLDRWALSNSRLKKKMAGYWFEYEHLRNCSCLHALTDAEVDSMRKFGLKNPICNIPNGIDLPVEKAISGAPPWTGTIFEGRRPLIFIGRIHPKKGLPLLLEAWSRVRKSDRSIADEWFIGIGGWDERGHISELRQIIDHLAIGKDVMFLGTLMGENKDSVLRAAQAYVLPSYSEGLPMSVLEAWAYSKPVLMTPQCNLKMGFDRGAAIRIETDVCNVAEGLRTLLKMNSGELESIGKKGIELVMEKFTWLSIAQEMRAVYRWLLEEGVRPGCVID